MDGESSTIQSNTATELTVSPAWSTTPDGTSTYKIYLPATEVTVSTEPIIVDVFVVPIPYVETATGVRGVLIDLHYKVSSDVDELGIEYTWDSGGGPSTADYDNLFGDGLTVTGDGVERIQNVGDFLFQEGWTDFSVTVTPRAGATEGASKTAFLEDADETGAGTKVGLSAGGTALSDYLTPGTNITIDTDADGRGRINASGGGSVAALEDVGDVGDYVSLAAGELIQYTIGIDGRHQ